MAVPFSAPGAFSGTLFSDVIAGDVTNPFGGLTFVYRVVNDSAAGPNSIGRLVETGFAGFLTDASYQVPTIDIAPALIDRNAAGDSVGFSFFPSPVNPFTDFLAPGLSSARLVIQSDSPFWTSTTASIIDGGTASAASFGPSLVVPELAQAGLLLGLGLGVMGFGLSRRHRHA